MKYNALNDASYYFKKEFYQNIITNKDYKPIDKSFNNGNTAVMLTDPDTKLQNIYIFNKDKVCIGSKIYIDKNKSITKLYDDNKKEKYLRQRDLKNYRRNWIEVYENGKCKTKKNLFYNKEGYGSIEIYHNGVNFSLSNVHGLIGGECSGKMEYVWANQGRQHCGFTKYKRLFRRSAIYKYTSRKSYYTSGLEPIRLYGDLRKEFLKINCKINTAMANLDNLKATFLKLKNLYRKIR